MIEHSGPHWVTGLMDTLGAPGAGLAIALENLFPPLPSEVILPLAGFASGIGQVGLVAVLVWTTAGSVVGALALYGIGAWLGHDRVVRIAERLPLVKAVDITRATAWFARHGPKAVFLGRMVPIFRSLISIPAGVERMPLPLFISLTTIGSAIWNATFVFAGRALGRNWSTVTDVASAYANGVLILGAVAALAFIVFRVLRPGGGQRRSRGSAGSARPLPPLSGEER